MLSVKPLTTVFLGPQGCGKGTQIKLFKEHLTALDPNRRIVHFEMGKLLREMAARPGYTEELVRGVLARGELVAYFISASLFSNFLMTELRGDEHLIIDGFPRQKEQVAALDSAMRFYKREQPTIICINISDEEALKRLSARGRGDDTEESIRRRLEWSRKETIPNVAWFRANDYYRVVDIDGEHPIEHTQEAIVQSLFPAA